jgi:hypothetical protein
MKRFPLLQQRIERALLRPGLDRQSDTNLKLDFLFQFCESRLEEAGLVDVVEVQAQLLVGTWSAGKMKTLG